MSSGFAGKSMEKVFLNGGQINKRGGQNEISTPCLTILIDFYPLFVHRSIFLGI